LPGILPGGDGSAASDAGGGGASAVATLLVVGVSGGCDSVALLHLLRDAVAGAENQKPRRGEWRILAAHFDHRRRGADSDGDREFVRELCRRLDVPLRCFYWGDRQRGRDGDDGDDGVVFTQERARQWRRSTMVRLLREEMTTLPDGSEKEGHRHQQQQAVRRVGLLVTAHHKDDSDETLLLKVLRGVHVTNVAGMKAFSAAVGEEETTTREESTGGNHPPLLFWARPLIHVRKSDLQQYLLENNYAWREDDSNLSGKYLRNRVRNELIPLLEDMVGGRDSLQRRLTNVEQQCQELRQDLNGRVETYLTDHVVDDGSLFLLPTTTDAPAEKFDLVVKEALHQWVVEQSDCYQFTYDQLQRVCSQIMNHEDRRQWRMNIGGGWDIQREGDSLRLVLEKIDQDEENHVVSSNNKVRELDWYLVDKSFNTEDTTASSGLLLLHVPRHYMLPRSIRFLYSTNDNSKLSITPPWRRRKGSSSRPIRVPEFLRGQKVPLHKRRDTPTITLQHGDDGAVSLVAVYVSTRNEWIVDEEFSFQEGEFSDEERDRVILEIG
jgi:tRNA(Ile)-lysidine synthetase-like protein